MPTDVEYQAAIQGYGRRELLELWDKVIAADTQEAFWTPGKAFEYLIVRAFELEGAEVRYPYIVKIAEAIVEQIDGVVYSHGLSCMIESKDWKGYVGFEPIAKLRNQLLRRPGSTIGAVFSRTGFTDPAVTLAQFLSPQTVLLWGGDEVLYALERFRMRESLLVKYRASVEQGLSYYNLVLGDLP